ncbi:MAG: hypothetical protein ACERKV_03395 [Clostridiaceae bacterium]
MDKNTIEKMKQIIEEKKQASSKQGHTKGAKEQKIGGPRRAFNNNKGGGLFDK